MLLLKGELLVYCIFFLILHVMNHAKQNKTNHVYVFLRLKFEEREKRCFQRDHMFGYTKHAHMTNVASQN